VLVEECPGAVLVVALAIAAHPEAVERVDQPHRQPGGDEQPAALGAGSAPGRLATLDVRAFHGRPDESSRCTRLDDGATRRFSMDQVVQVLGSLLILAAFAAAQRGWLSAHSPSYLALNLVGASVLAFLAAQEHQLGFLLLEFSWALVAGYSLLAGRLRSRRATRGRPQQPGCENRLPSDPSVNQSAV
jgi:hypothetical protein